MKKIIIAVAIAIVAFLGVCGAYTLVTEKPATAETIEIEASKGAHDDAVEAKLFGQNY